MIFRLDGGVECLLALTPVLAEWRRRNGGPVLVETRFPELFLDNPHVDAAAESVSENDVCMDMNLVPWPSLAMNVTELYASRVLGDVLLRSWRTVMASMAEDMATAAEARPKGRVAAYYVDGAEMDVETDLRMRAELERRGYRLVNLARMSPSRARAATALSDMFVGTDGPMAAVAFTTDVPAVVCYTWRDPCCFRPFRGCVPFEPLLHDEKVCDEGKVCLAKNGRHELGKVYGHRCPKSPAWACRGIPFDEMAARALDRIEARA